MQIGYTTGDLSLRWRIVIETNGELKWSIASCYFCTSITAWIGPPINHIHCSGRCQLSDWILSAVTWRPITTDIREHYHTTRLSRHENLISSAARQKHITPVSLTTVWRIRAQT